MFVDLRVTYACDATIFSLPFTTYSRQKPRIHVPQSPTLTEAGRPVNRIELDQAEDQAVPPAQAVQPLRGTPGRPAFHTATLMTIDPPWDTAGSGAPLTDR